MDPFTLLAAANAAVAAVKKGCELYKEIKGAAGDVKDVLADLKEQFGKIQNPSNEQKLKYNAEVQRVQEIAKTDPGDAFAQIGQDLGKLMDAYDEIGKAFIKQEINAKQVYRGEESIGKRALTRIMVQARLDSMLAEIREMMVYQAPPELGDLWGKFERMWQQIVAEQERAYAEEMKQMQIAQWRRKKAIEDLKAKTAWISAVVFVVLYLIGILWLTTKSATMYRGLF